MRDPWIFLRLRGLKRLEKERKAKRRKKMRWSDYSDCIIPAIWGPGTGKEWIRRLKEKSEGIGNCEPGLPLR
jgi:hypothetical protein